VAPFLNPENYQIAKTGSRQTYRKRREQKAIFPAGESHDRNEHYGSAGQLQLPGSQQDLVEAVAAAQPNYVVVFINGGALGTDWIAQHSPAVVEAFYPGKRSRSKQKCFTLSF
jgi:hypothetical protein